MQNVNQSLNDPTCSPDRPNIPMKGYLNGLATIAMGPGLCRAYLLDWDIHDIKYTAQKISVLVTYSILASIICFTLKYFALATASLLGLTSTACIWLSMGLLTIAVLGFLVHSIINLVAYLYNRVTAPTENVESVASTIKDDVKISDVTDEKKAQVEEIKVSDKSAEALAVDAMASLESIIENKVEESKK